MTVEVLLSTYRGRRWLEPQLDSVLGQTHGDLRLTVRDDGSDDGTVDLLRSYAARDPRVRWTQGENLGAAASFLHLLAHADPTAEAVAFCDQDDVWEPDHLARALAALADVPGPALWCCDLLVCDEDLTPLRRHAVVRRGPSFANALVENVAPGCATVLDPAAVALLQSALPARAVMHDAWCYLVLAALGQVVHDPEPSVRYRLHGGNTVGLGTSPLRRALQRLGRVLRPPGRVSWSGQAEELRRTFGPLLPEDVRDELDRFLDPRPAARLRYAVRGTAARQGRLGTVGVRALHVLGRL